MKVGHTLQRSVIFTQMLTIKDGHTDIVMIKYLAYLGGSYPAFRPEIKIYETKRPKFSRVWLLFYFALHSLLVIFSSYFSLLFLVFPTVPSNYDPKTK